VFRNYYIILIFPFFLSCSQSSLQTFNGLDEYKQENYNDIVLEFLKNYNIVLNKFDTIILYDLNQCIPCEQDGIHEKLMHVNPEKNILIVFSEEDSIYIKNIVENPLEIAVKSDTFLKQNKVIHSKPYYYFIDLNTEKLVGKPL